MSDQTEAEIRNAALEEAERACAALPYESFALTECISAIRKLKSAPAAEQHPDDIAVDRFAAAMKAKLAKKRAEGRGGWNDKEQCTGDFLSALLRDHVDKGDPLDVGNLAMMLHQRGERISAQAAAPDWPAINVIIARHFADDPANACRAHATIAEVLRAQPAASAEPSKEECWDIWQIAARAEGFLDDRIHRFACDLLDRYGRPAGDAQPVADHKFYPHPGYRAFCQKCGKAEADHPTAPVAAQKADDALRAIKKIFDKPVTFVGDGPNSTVVVPFESHTQAWNHWHEAREIIDAAIAQQRKGE